MQKLLPVVLVCAALGACSSEDIDESKATVESAIDDIKDSGNDALDAAESTADSIGDSARKTLDRASKAAEELEDAGRRRAEAAADAAKQARADAENKVREELARLEAQRDAARKTKDEFQREIRIGEEEN